eukprot:gene12221-14311_t
MLKQVRPNQRISREAVEILISFSKDILYRLGSICNDLKRIDNKATLKARDVQTACRLVLNGELAKHAVVEIMVHVTSADKGRGRYNSNSDDAESDVPKKKPTKLIIPATFIKRALASLFIFGRVAKDATVAVAAIIEYVLFEIIELAGNVAQSCGRV